MHLGDPNLYSLTLTIPLNGRPIEDVIRTATEAAIDHEGCKEYRASGVTMKVITCRSSADGLSVHAILTVGAKGPQAITIAIAQAFTALTPPPRLAAVDADHSHGAGPLRAGRLLPAPPQERTGRAAPKKKAAKGRTRKAGHVRTR